MMFALFALSAFAEPTALEQDVHKRLLVRDGFVGCEALYELGDDLAVRDAILAATVVQRPPWVSMRAAACVVERAATDEVAYDVVRGWMTDPNLAGFALAAVQGLDLLPEDRAVVIAELAVDRVSTDARFARYAPEHLRKSSHPKVQDVATRLPPSGK